MFYWILRQFCRIINKSEGLDNIYSLFQQNIKSCNAEGDITFDESHLHIYTFWRTTQQRKTAQTLVFARLLIYRYSIIFEILGFRHSTVLILVFDGVKVKTTNTGSEPRLRQLSAHYQVLLRTGFVVRTRFERRFPPFFHRLWYLQESFNIAVHCYYSLATRVRWVCCRVARSVCK